MKKVLFIHGFASSGQSQKAHDLAKMLNCEVIAPDLKHQPEQDIQSLEIILKNESIELIVGSSLGGFYALLLGMRQPYKLLLINPSLHPHLTLQDRLGYVESFKGNGFDWSSNEINALAKFATDLQLSENANIQMRMLLKQTLVLLARHDERLNAQETIHLLKDAQIIVDDEQDHRFADLTKYTPYIQQLYLA